ncbi:MAG: autotransporter-associated beta strand repeat-containing protein [Enhydrobacter sp.]|nr:MAG: autotransporter-associated beta strand repeat-containing protein [Enhydrobacter sp.]
MRKRSITRAAKRRRRKAQGLAAAMCALPLGATETLAQSTWLYTGTNYGTGANWSTGTVPGAGNSAIFNADGANQPIIAGSFTIGTVSITAGSLTINSTRTLTVQTAFDISNASVLGAGTLSLGAGSTLTASGASAIGLAPVISGSGATAITGADVTFTGNNTYSGGTTIASGAQLSVGAGGTTGGLGSGATVNDGSLLFNRSNTLAVASAISGSGTVTKLGAGTTQLTGNNSYGGTTTISAGTLSIGSGGTTGTLGTGDVVNNATLLFSRSDDTITIANDISGTGAVTKSNAGTNTTLVLTGNNSYAGTTTITEGTLQIGSGGTTGSLGTGNVVTSGGILRFERSDDISVANNITGTGQLNKQGANALTLTGANTYSGATTIANGTLQIGDGGTTGTLGTGATSNEGSLLFNRSDAFTVSSAISGSGTVSQVGSGTTSLSGVNTYTGTTTISNGTLQLGAGTGSTTATLGAGAIVNDGVLQINRSNAATIANDISGSGALTKTGAGTNTVLTLTGNNTYSGTTTITEGTLRIGDGGTTGSLGSGSVDTSGGTLQFNRSDDISIANTITGTGGLGKLLDNVVTLTGNNTYSGTTTISAGTLQVGDGGTVGMLGGGNVSNSGDLVFNRSDTITHGGVISGTGNVSQIGSGSTILTGNNTYSGTTTIADGTLQIGNGGTTGQLGTGATTNDSVLVFDRSNALTVASAISGSGTVEQAGTGTTSLSGDNTYTGTTTISAGTLSVGAGGTTGSLGSGAVVNNSILQVNRSNDVTVANDISGTGSLAKTTAGTSTVLTLTGNNSYSGTTTITEGTLRIGDGGTTGSLGSGNVNTSGGILQFNRSDDISVANTITGTGQLGKLLDNVLTLTGNNTYSGITTITEGTLQVGDGGTSGSLGTGGVTNNAILVFNRSDEMTVANVVSGTGNVSQAGSGTTTLTGANTYSGTTTISTGTLQIGAGGGAGQLGTGATTNDGALVINRTGSLAISSSISGTGTLTHAGTGTTSLTGTNSFSGTTTIDAGILSVGAGGTAGTLGTGNVVNNATLQVNRSDAIAIANEISGSGGLTKLAAGTATLTGDNSYAGTTTITAGTLQIGDGGTTGSLGIGNVAVSGTLAFNRSDDIAIANTISGAGALAKLGGNTVTLTGNNTHSGATTIADGTLQIGSGGTSGQLGTGATTNAGNLLFNRSDALTVASAISGSGSVGQIGSGITSLTGTNTYSGTTTIADGVLSLGAGGSSGTLGTGAVINDATLQFNRTNAFTVDNDISGSGNLSKLLGNTVTLTGSNSYSGTTTISAGTLAIGAGGTIGSLGTGDVVNNATLSFNRSDDIAVANQISGSGGLSKQGTNTLTLTADNSYTGATSIAVGGALQLGDGGTSGSLGGGTVANAGSLLFNRSDALTVSGAISGVGAVSQIGGGTTVLTGANTYSGGTTIAGGALQIGDGGTTGALGGGATVNDAGLLFNRSNAFTVASAISGSGTVTQLGDGTTSLTGANSYTGVTTITGGTLSVGAGGTIGTLGTGDVVNNATLLINRSDAALTIANNLSGSGALTKSAAGTNTVLTLTGNNSYSGLTTITEGTLQIGDGGTTGSLGTGEVVTTGGVLRFNRIDDISVANTISGTGSLAKLLDNVLTLTGDNSYSGTTAISAGTLQVGAGGTSGSLGTGAVANNGTLAINRSDDLSIANAISGTGSLEKLLSNVLTLTANNTYSGTTTIAAGTLAIGSGGTTGSLGSGAVANDGHFVLDRSNAMTVANDISGSGSVAQSGSGTTTLTGSNSYTGATTIAAGTLVVGAAGTTGTLGTGDVINDGILQINRSDAALTIANNISGTGALTKSAAGTNTVLTLTGNNSYSGLTTIAEGTLQIGAGGTAGSLGTGNVAVTGTLAFNRSDDIAVANTISGAGALAKLGGNTVTLTGNNSYSGATTIADGTLQVGSGGGSGTLGTGNVTNNGSLLFNRADALVVPGIISGTGSVSQIGAGTTTLTGNSTYNGTTTISSGTLQIGDGGASGALGSGDVTNSANLVFNRSNGLTVGSAISGTGTVAQIGAGTTSLSGANTYSGTTTISGGTLSIGAGGTSGTLGTGNVVNDGTLQINRADAVTIANAIAGSGALTKLVSNTVTLTGNNTYSGTTTIADGTLRIGAGGTTGSLGTGNVVNDAMLEINRSDTVSIANAISGTGGLNHIGSGTTTLTGTSTYGGATSVTSGTLQVDGSIASSSDLTVASGARVGGIGTLPSTTVAAGAFLAAGNAAIGTLQIAGNLTLAPGSTTTIRVNGALADRVNVTGGAAVSGALQVVALSATFNNPYTVLTAAGGRTGSFTSSSVSGSFGAGIVPTVTYDANNVYLSLAPTPIVPIVPSPTPNQAAVAAGLDRAVASGANVSAFFPLYNLPANAVPQALNQISGAVHANVGAVGSLTSGQFTSSLTDPNRASTRVIFDAAVQRATQPSAETCASADSCDANERALGPVTPDMGIDPLTAWIGALGLVRRVTGDGARTDTAGGVSVGLDKGVMPGVRLGIAFSGGSASSSPDNGLSSIRAEVLQAGTYAQMQTGPWLLNGALSYATMDIISNRQIPVLGQYNVAAQYRTHGLGGRLEGMVDLYGVDGFTFGPSAALQGSIVWNPDFQEWSNGAPAGVSVLAGSNMTARGEIGARVNYFGTVFGLGTSAFARAAYAHYFVRQSNITASLTDLPQGGFALTSGQVDMNAGILSAGFDVRLNERTTIGLQLETEFSRTEFQAVGGARVRFSF